MKEIGIYIHIPFCVKKCEYCDFVSFSDKSNLIKDYIEAVKEEIENIKIDDKYKVTTLYFGGGTPSSIDSNYIVEIIKEIERKFNLKDVEITIEINPGTVTKEKLQTYIDNKINRISIGLQTTSNKLLKEIGRTHTYEDFITTYELARKIGFKNINIDLMIGLPTQIITDVEIDLNEIKKLQPEHISVYSLIIEEGTKIEDRIFKKELYLPSEEEERKMYWTVKKKLESLGYEHYEISNYAKHKFKSKHNWNCWNQKEYMGIGVAAHSYIDKTRLSNISNMEEYIKTKGTKKTIHEKQTKEMAEKEFMLLGLRKIEGVKISEFKNKFIDNPIYLFKNELTKLTFQKLLEIDGNIIKLTDRGINVSNLVWEEFI